MATVNKDVANLPNIRKMFKPDPGYMIFDVDLAGADAQVVAYEADDRDLIAAFRAGLDVHSKNAADIFGERFTVLEGAKRKAFRNKNKQGVHGTNYGSTANTLASILGWTRAEAERFQATWFSLHPGIKHVFHAGVERSLRSERRVTNRFGYSNYYFNRIEKAFTEALAWIPQSTVAIVCFKGALQLERHFPQVEMLCQVHDSLIFQLPFKYADDIDRIKEGLLVPVPYPDPLYIQWSVARSEVSWGDCVAV